VTLTVGTVIEGVQGVLTVTNLAPYSTSSSAFSIEDPVSNALGGKFGAYYRENCKDKTVSQALRDFFAQYGPYENPAEVPGYSQLQPSQQALEQAEKDAGYLGRTWGAVSRTFDRTVEFVTPTVQKFLKWFQ